MTVFVLTEFVPLGTSTCSGWLTEATDLRRYDFIARGFAPVEERAEYFPIGFIEPAGERAAWLGFDTLSETSRRDAIERAQDYRTAVATEALPVHTPGTALDTFEIYQPVYVGRPVAAVERPAGFIIARFRVARVVQFALTGYDDDLLQVDIYEGHQPRAGRLLYTHAGDPTKPQAVRSRPLEEKGFVVPLSVAGRSWTVVGQPTETFRRQNRQYTAWGLLLFGLCASGLGAAYITSLQARRVQMAALIGQLTETNRALEHEIAEHERAEAELRKLSEVVQQNPVSVLITDPEGRIEYVNDSFCAMTGYEPRDVIGQTPRVLSSGKMNPDVFAAMWQEVKAGRKWSGELLNKRKDGSQLWQHVIVTPIRDEQGRVVHLVGLQEDVSEQKLLQDQLQQSQKMEVVGRLAGGIAHDFNNILTTMIGFSDLLREELKEDDSRREFLDQIARAADRARLLTRQLLMFARKDTVRRRPLDANRVVNEVKEFLRRTLGEDIRLRVSCCAEPAMVLGDPSQLDQVIMNLGVNARDAMPNGGELQVTTTLTDLDETFCRRHPGVKPGRHVLLSVADKGTGMSEEVQKHIFEPFFTTKGVGKGTGLGLSTVYGIVKQMAGEIEVRSELGQGTEFRIYLPLASGEEAEVAVSELVAGLPRGTETILVVEDDDMVRNTTVRLLTDLGYKVSGAASAREAMDMCERRGKNFDLVFTDIVMPGMSGVEMVQQLGRKKLVNQVIFASGFSEHPSVDEQLIQHEFRFMAKPFSRDMLGRLVRTVLDEYTPPKSGSSPAS